MKKVYLVLLTSLLVSFTAMSQNLLNCSFTVAAKACIGQEVKVTYTGGVSVNATYVWNFDGATIISGTGQGPWFVKWATTGEKHVTLNISFEGQTCSSTNPVVVIEQPALFHMMGGGIIVPGSQGVNVGLSGSESGIIYKLRLNGQYTGVVVPGTGQAISFGLQTVPGNYSAVARVDGSDCMREMEGLAIVTAGQPALQPFICMVTFDTAESKNKIIWNKHDGLHIAHYNIYKETYQNNIYAKIGEVPFSSFSAFLDPSSNPLVKSDKFKISITDSAGLESEKSPHHKTIHLNISPGIFGFNLIWNHYEGFDYQTYRIHRQHEGDAWQVIDSVASNVDSYTDLYSTSGVMTYFIEVVRPEPCNPSFKVNESISLISNTATAAPLGIVEDKRSGIQAYPNPVIDRLTLLLPGSSECQVEILQSDGITVLKYMASGPKAEVNVSHLNHGFYILKITTNGNTVVQKLIKN
jgi:hypothetical protein